MKVLVGDRVYDSVDGALHDLDEGWDSEWPIENYPLESSSNIFKRETLGMVTTFLVAIKNEKFILEGGFRESGERYVPVAVFVRSGIAKELDCYYYIEK